MSDGACEPVVIENANGSGPFVILCDHASNRIPERYVSFGYDRDALAAQAQAKSEVTPLAVTQPEPPLPANAQQPVAKSVSMSFRMPSGGVPGGDAELVAANSTADAAQQVAAADRSDVASIGTLRGAELAGLEVLASEIEDHPSETRFVLIGHGVPAETGHDKTSIVCFQRENRPGSLLAILQEFAARAIDLTKLESRPRPNTPWEYLFYIDFEGSLADAEVRAALDDLRGATTFLKVLGSYPVASAPTG